MQMDSFGQASCQLFRRFFNPHKLPIHRSLNQIQSIACEMCSSSRRAPGTSNLFLCRCHGFLQDIWNLCCWDCPKWSTCSWHHKFITRLAAIGWMVLRGIFTSAVFGSRRAFLCFSDHNLAGGFSPAQCNGQAATISSSSAIRTLRTRQLSQLLHKSGRGDHPETQGTFTNQGQAQPSRCHTILAISRHCALFCVQSMQSAIIFPRTFATPLLWNSISHVWLSCSSPFASGGICSIPCNCALMQFPRVLMMIDDSERMSVESFSNYACRILEFSLLDWSKPVQPEEWQCLPITGGYLELVLMLFKHLLAPIHPHPQLFGFCCFSWMTRRFHCQAHPRSRHFLSER